MKLWKKDSTNTSALIEEFTVGRDKEFDILLAKYDVQATIHRQPAQGSGNAAHSE